MAIEICEICGSIVRGRKPVCAECGIAVSKFATGALPDFPYKPAALRGSVNPDDLVLERTLSQQRCQEAVAAGMNQYSPSFESWAGSAIAEPSESDAPPAETDANMPDTVHPSGQLNDQAPFISFAVSLPQDNSPDPPDPAHESEPRMELAPPLAVPSSQKEPSSSHVPDEMLNSPESHSSYDSGAFGYAPPRPIFSLPATPSLRAAMASTTADEPSVTDKTDSFLLDEKPADQSAFDHSGNPTAATDESGVEVESPAAKYFIASEAEDQPLQSFEPPEPPAVAEPVAEEVVIPVLSVSARPMAPSSATHIDSPSVVPIASASATPMAAVSTSASAAMVPFAMSAAPAVARASEPPAAGGPAASPFAAVPAAPPKTATAASSPGPGGMPFSPIAGGAGPAVDFFAASGFGSSDKPGIVKGTETTTQKRQSADNKIEQLPSLVADAIAKANSARQETRHDMIAKGSDSATESEEVLPLLNQRNKTAQSKIKDDADADSRAAERDDESDDSDDSSEDEATSKAAKSKRRSFSDRAAEQRARRESSRDSESDSQSDIAGRLKKIASSLNIDTTKSFKIGSFEFSLGDKQTQCYIAAAVTAVFVVTMLFHLLGPHSPSTASPAGSGAGGGGGGVSLFNFGGQPGLGGTWQFGASESRGGTVKGQWMLEQSGNTFRGNGVDQYGAFAVIDGTCDYPNIKFLKVYIDRNNKPLSKPIQYGGKVDWVNPEPGKGPFYQHMYGQWMLTKREGYGWRGHEVTLNGKWEAAMTAVPDVTTSAGGPQGNFSKQSNPIGDFFGFIFGFPQPGDAHGWPNFFAHIAILLIILGLVLVLASVRLFGPAGMLNIWNKKEYIPSQFKSQWTKMLQKFSKPLKPGGLPLGTRTDFNPFNFYLPRVLNMPPEVRKVNPHMLLLGAGGKGKSRLMANFIAHDIESADRAVVVIDSDGSLIDLMTNWVAAHPRASELAERLIVIDPTRPGDKIAYNPLAFPDDGDLQSAASAVVFGFKAIYTEPPGAQSQWNQQTANILRNSALLLMANGRTLTDLPVLLSENDFRDVLLEKVERMKDQKAEYTTLLEAWAQYKRLARTDQWITWVEPILNRVQPMLGDPRIRPILTKPQGELNLKDVIREGKILFVKVPQGQLDQHASLLGSLIVTGLKQAALSLSLKSKSRKNPCVLYLDEMDNFIEKETFEHITAETRKFQMSLVAATKSLQEMPEDYRGKVISHVGTMCCFSLVKKDGDMLGPQMFRVDGRKVKHQTLQNIFNKVNTAPQFELIMDEEKLNIDRIVGQEDRTYFCYLVGTVAGVFKMKAPDFNDISEKQVNWSIIEQIHAKSGS